MGGDLKGKIDNREGERSYRSGCLNGSGDDTVGCPVLASNPALGLHWEQVGSREEGTSDFSLAGTVYGIIFSMGDYNMSTWDNFCNLCILSIIIVN